MQSRALAGVIVPLLMAGVSWVCVTAGSVRALLFPVGFSVGFAALVYGLRSATLPAAAVGMLVCLILARTSMALPALVALFVLTFAATQFGRRKKEVRGLAEARSGRKASQVIANLGVAGLCGAIGWYPGCIAALAEAAADTASSEVGQALGRRAWQITTLRPVPPGSDGGISAVGTMAGVTAAGIVVLAGSARGALSLGEAARLFAAGCAGLIFDSLLGATVEERGWLGNDLVNFISTGFAALVACILLPAQPS